MLTSAISSALFGSLAFSWAGMMTGVLVLAFVAISILMVLTVLIQRPAGGGLSGAFGSGAGSGQTAFGTKTGDALTIATITMFVLFLVFAIVLNYVARPPEPGSQTPAAAPAETIPATTTPTTTTPPGPTGGEAPAPAPTGEAPAGQPQPAPASGETPPASGGNPPASSEPTTTPTNPPATPPAGPPG
ncbi:MAG: preprotein translocase subunit SecG [Phycisphaerales bacterium]